MISMTMTIVDFIEQQYPIIDVLRARLKDPVKAVMENDNLPYDSIGPDENGNLTKLVEIEDGVSIPVSDLISYTKEDIEKHFNENLKAAWEAYMSIIDLQDIEIADIIASTRRYNEVRDKRKELLGKCT